MKTILWAVGIMAASVALFFAAIGYLGGSPFSSSEATYPSVAPARGGLGAVILSGDMGSRIGMAPSLADALGKQGIPVVSVNSLTYFRVRRTPEQAGKLLVAAVNRALSLPRVDRVVLIGQSYGADMLQVGLARLPAGLRHNIIMTALIVPGATVEYRASPGEIFTFAMAEDDALPSARRLNWLPVLCIYGREESHSLCPLLHSRNVKKISLPGGHPLHHDASAVLRVLLPAIHRSLGRAHITEVSESDHVPDASRPA